MKLETAQSIEVQKLYPKKINIFCLLPQSLGETFESFAIFLGYLLKNISASILLGCESKEVYPATVLNLGLPTRQAVRGAFCIG